MAKPLVCVVNHGQISNQHPFLRGFTLKFQENRKRGKGTFLFGLFTIFTESHNSQIRVKMLQRMLQKLKDVLFEN